MDLFTNRRASDMYNTGMAFFANAGDFLQQIPANGVDETWFTAERRAKLEVAVTNLAFSIELLLKALLLSTGRTLRTENGRKPHDLRTLFDALPSEIQESIEREYKERGGESPSGNAMTLELVF